MSFSLLIFLVTERSFVWPIRNVSATFLLNCCATKNLRCSISKRTLALSSNSFGALRQTTDMKQYPCSVAHFGCCVMVNFLSIMQYSNSAIQAYFYIDISYLRSCNSLSIVHAISSKLSNCAIDYCLPLVLLFQTGSRRAVLSLMHCLPWHFFWWIGLIFVQGKSLFSLNFQYRGSTQCVWIRPRTQTTAKTATHRPSPEMIVTYRNGSLSSELPNVKTCAVLHIFQI